MPNMAVGVRVEGLNALTRSLLAAGVEVDDLKDAFSSIAKMGARVAAGLAPHRSGRLAADIRGNRARNKAVVISGRASVPYAGPINYGWPDRNITASLYLQRAERELEPYALRRLQANIDAAIRRAGF